MQGFLDQSVDCDSVLISNVTKLDENLEVRLAWLKTIDESTYETAKSSANARLDFGIEGLFDAGYSQFDERRRMLFDQENSDYSIASARQILLYHVPSQNIQAWQTCVIEKMDTASVACWVQEMSPDGAVLNIRWKANDGMPELRGVQVRIFGGTNDEGRSVLILVH